MELMINDKSDFQIHKKKTPNLFLLYFSKYTGILLNYMKLCIFAKGGMKTVLIPPLI